MKGDIITLWGSAVRKLEWMRTAWESGGNVSRETIAWASPEGMTVRWTDDLALGDRVYKAWAEILAGNDLDHLATHRLAPPHYHTYEPKEQP